MLLIDEVLTPENLAGAWHKVRGNHGSAGVDGITIAQFANHADRHLEDLRLELVEGRYKPSPLVAVFLDKGNGKLRRLTIPTVRDRIAQTAVLRVVAPIIDRKLKDCSYAYRPAHSVGMAVARVAGYREQGFRWVVDADISNFFDEVDHVLLLEKLGSSMPDQSVIPLIEAWLAVFAEGRDEFAGGSPAKGISQGAPLSPLLANLYLDGLDELVLAENLRMVRFADDFLVLCRRRQDAINALELTENFVKTLKLKLNADKTRIVSFTKGFRFLGVDFLRNLLLASKQKPTEVARHPRQSTPASVPPAQPPEEASHQGGQFDQINEGAGVEIEPVCSESLSGQTACLHSLHVTTQGTLLLKEDERIVVTRKREVLGSVPLGKVDQIMVHGNALISTALLRRCAHHEIAVHLADRVGRIVGTWNYSGADRTALLERQFAAYGDDAFRLGIARSIAEGKIHNMRVLLSRYNRRRRIDEVASLATRMQAMQKKVGLSMSLDAIRGCEGLASRFYFRALREFLPADWAFPGRVRRPPDNPFNALLSYGYAVLFQSVLTLIQREGLDPHLAALHSRRHGFAALAADLMEEFRAMVVDTCALQIVQNGRLQERHFSMGTRGESPVCFLDDEAKRIWIDLLETKLHSPISHPAGTAASDYLRVIRAQVRQYRALLNGAVAEYRPFRVR